MKYIKTYETLNDFPKNGDYVICKNDYLYVATDRDDLNNFLKNNIGQIVDIQNLKYSYIIKFNNVPTDIRDYFNTDYLRGFTRREILHYSKNKKDLELFINVNKFNL